MHDAEREPFLLQSINRLVLRVDFLSKYACMAQHPHEGLSQLAYPTPKEASRRTVEKTTELSR